MGVAYALEKDYRKEFSTAGKVGNLALIPADLGGSILFVYDVKSWKQPKWISHSVSLLYISAYLLIAVNSLAILLSRKTSVVQKRQALLDLANGVFQITLAIFFLFSYIFLSLRIMAGALSCAGFLHKKLSKG